MASILLITEYFSIFSYILPRLRKPAVSITTYSFPSDLNLVSIVSLVVPSIGDTITLLSLSKVFVNDDFPTLGRPIKQNLIASNKHNIFHYILFFPNNLYL